jgi:hypothetical protein
MNNTGPLEKGTLPSNMFEMDVVKDALQRRIDAGEETGREMRNEESIEDGGGEDRGRRGRV